MSKLGDETLVRRFWQYVRPRRVYTEEDIGKIIGANTLVAGVCIKSMWILTTKINSNL